MYNSPFFSIHF